MGGLGGGSDPIDAGGGSGGGIIGVAGMTGATGAGGAQASAGRGGAGQSGGLGGLGGVSVPNGTAMPGVAWVTVNSVATGDQDNAAIAAVRTGYVAVVWEDDRDDAATEDSLHSEIFLRLFLNGASLYEVKLSAGGSGDWRHIQPDVALFDDGRALVVWAAEADGNGYYNIQVRLVDTDGIVAGSARANGSVDGQQSYPAVAAAPDGTEFAVVWEDEQTGTPPTVRVAGFSSIGSKTYEEQVHAAGGTHRRPDVAMGAAGNAIVVWEEDGDGNGTFNVGRKVFTPAGAVKQAESVANASAAGQRRRPSVAANFNGDFAVAWETDQSGAFAAAVRSFTAHGQARTTADTLLRGTDPQVGIDDEQRVVVASVDASDVYVQGLNPDGTLGGRLPRVVFGQTTTGRQDEPALAVDAWGRLTLVYTDDNDGNLFDQVILGTGLGNSVW